MKWTLIIIVSASSLLISTIIPVCYGDRWQFSEENALEASSHLSFRVSAVHDETSACCKKPS